MATSVEQAKQEITANPVTAKATTTVQVPPELRAAAAAQAASGDGRTLPGVNVQDFITSNRIHVKNGSLFVDPYLVLHPHELAPANEAALRKKLALTFSLNNPSFFEAQDRASIALNLGALIPVSAQAKHSKLLDEIAQFNQQVDTGTDAALTKELQDKRTPFAAIVRDVTQHPAGDPVGLETLKNSIAVYLLVREKLTQNRYLDKLSNYVQRSNTPDQILSDLSEKIGITPIAFREAALKGGVDGIGQLLGLDPVYVADVKKFTEHAATQDFGYNTVEHWHLGRQLQGLKASLAEKLAVGMEARITAKIDEWRNKVRHQFEVPEPVKKEEQRIAEGLNLVDPIQRALMFKLGYEICFSPEVNADDIAFYRGIYGLHRKAANDLRDTQGTYRIYFSGRGDLKGSMRTLVHEVAHNLWPEQFTPAEVTRIDQYANADQQRFAAFQQLMDTHYGEFEKLFNAYKAGSTQEKAAVIAATNQQFAAYGLQADQLFPVLRDAHDFQFAVKHLHDTLSIEGERYNRSNYNGPEERFREVISRFAELKQVEYRGEPQFLQFLAPGLSAIWNQHYIPQLNRVYTGIENGTLPATRHAANAVLKETDDTQAQPKVEEIPVVPAPTQKPTPAPIGADSVMDAPSTMIDASSAARIAPAMAALTSMGVGANVSR